LTPGAITTRFLGGDELRRGVSRQPLGKKIEIKLLACDTMMTDIGPNCDAKIIPRSHVFCCVGLPGVNPCSNKFTGGFPYGLVLAGFARKSGT
jgi:hypothetical protein